MVFGSNLFLMMNAQNHNFQKGGKGGSFLVEKNKTG
jgi:hypothetical protein